MRKPIQCQTMGHDGCYSLRDRNLNTGQMETIKVHYVYGVRRVENPREES